MWSVGLKTLRRGTAFWLPKCVGSERGGNQHPLERVESQEMSFKDFDPVSYKHMFVLLVS